MAAVEEWVDGELVSRVETPDPPSPYADALDALAAASTVAEVKARALDLFALLTT